VASCADESDRKTGKEVSLRLGGFKILKGLWGVSVCCTSNEIESSVPLLQRISQKKINIPYLTLSYQTGGHGYHLLCEEPKFSRFLDDHSTACLSRNNRDLTVLSLFPHRNDLRVLARVLEITRRQKTYIHGLASSPSALSLVLDKRNLEKLTYALFGPFTFSSYRTPSDWKLAQKGKEKLFKEVVASYQEKRPKIYGLECWRETFLAHMILEQDSFELLRALSAALAEQNARLIFVNSTPTATPRKHSISFCYTGVSEDQIHGILQRIHTEEQNFSQQEAVILNMTGPHFGDRYGLATRLLQAMSNEGVVPLAMGCTVASMGLVVSKIQAEKAVLAINREFDTLGLVEKCYGINSC